MAALVGNLGGVRRKTGRLLAGSEEAAVEAVEEEEAVGGGDPLDEVP